MRRTLTQRSRRRRGGENLEAALSRLAAAQTAGTLSQTSAGFEPEAVATFAAQRGVAIRQFAGAFAGALAAVAGESSKGS